MPDTYNFYIFRTLAARHFLRKGPLIFKVAKIPIYGNLHSREEGQ